MAGFLSRHPYAAAAVGGATVAMAITRGERWSHEPEKAGHVLRNKVKRALKKGAYVAAGALDGIPGVLTVAASRHADADAGKHKGQVESVANEDRAGFLRTRAKNAAMDKAASSSGISKASLLKRGGLMKPRTLSLPVMAREDVDTVPPVTKPDTSAPPVTTVKKGMNQSRMAKKAMQIKRLRDIVAKRSQTTETMSSGGVGGFIPGGFAVTPSKKTKVFKNKMGQKFALTVAGESLDPETLTYLLENGYIEESDIPELIEDGVLEGRVWNAVKRVAKVAALGAMGAGAVAGGYSIGRHFVKTAARKTNA